MGKLIVIEGSCDGVGKNTQYKLLVDRLMKDNEKVITTHHFPSYGTYQGRPVEEYLKGLNYFKEIVITRAGGVISSHCGPGTLGVLFIADSKDAEY